MENIIRDLLEGKFDNYKFVLHPYYDSRDAISGGDFCILDSDRELITKFKLTAMVGCNGIVISSSVSINSKHRGKGYGSLFCELRERIANLLGYSMITCTVVESNEPQKRIMAKRGWEILHKFQNRKTGNVILLYGKNISNLPPISASINDTETSHSLIQ